MDFEYYPTPFAFTRYLYWALAKRGTPVAGKCFEPCVGDGAIMKAGIAEEVQGVPTGRRMWTTNDLDPRWLATSSFTKDATQPDVWQKVGTVDWVVTNPPFTKALPILEYALRAARVGVAMHLRASIHEVLKTGPRRTWMRDHCPTGLLWLPRFAYQRSKTSGAWTTDSVCACWVVWRSSDASQFLDYAPPWVLKELDDSTPAYRQRMDALMAYREEDTARDGAFVGEIP